MCDFKPGDEVQAIKTESGYDEIVVGAIYTVREYCETMRGDGSVINGEFTLFLVEAAWDFRGPGTGGYEPSWFRKVERRTDSLSIEAFLTIKPGFEEPRRAPAKKRERVR